MQMGAYDEDAVAARACESGVIPDPIRIEIAIVLV
jgi:hypothetical protein